MFKKILGVFFFLFGILCVLSAIGNVLSLVIGRRGESTIETAEIITAIVLTVVFGFLFFKYALKWTSKQTPKEEIEDIGK